MCEIVPASDDTHGSNVGYLQSVGSVTVIENNIDYDRNIIIGEYHLNRELIVDFPEEFFKYSGEFWCKHPDTDWHQMEVEPGVDLVCPVDTTIRLVYPDA